jgi:hypothetical protein
MTKLKGAPEASKGSFGGLRSLCSIKVPPKALREEAIRGLRGTFLDVVEVTFRVFEVREHL